jgi:predicted porin
MWTVLLAQVAVAPSAPPAEETPTVLQRLAQRVDVYGRFDGHLAVTRDDARVANNSSRLGVKAEQDVAGGLSVIAQGEWRISVGKGDTTYNVTENPDTGLGQLQTASSPALTTRLGYVGLRHPEYGSLTLGKQWGVYYDVSLWTDQFVVFGAHGSSTYNAGTDGGQTGEGRANDAIAYRVGHGPVKLGVQAQFIPERSPVLDSLSGSLVVALGAGLKVGVAYSRAFLELGSNVVGYGGGDAQAFTAGISFEASGWKLAALDTWTRDHEFVTSNGVTVAYDTLGAELFLSRSFRDLLMLYGGFDFAIPRHLDAEFVDPDYSTRDVLGGARWLFDAKAGSFAYLEARTGRTRDTAGVRADDAVMLGIRFNYSLRKALGM